MYPLKSNINYFVKENNNTSNNTSNNKENNTNNNNFIEECGEFFHYYNKDNYDFYFEKRNNDNLKENNIDNDIFDKTIFNKDNILYRGLNHLNKNKLLEIYYLLTDLNFVL